METRDLIRAIAADAGTPAVSLQSASRAALGFAVAAAAITFFATIGPRPDIAEAVHTIRFLFKLVFSLVFAASAFFVFRVASRPDADLRRALPWLAAAPVLLAVAIILELLAVPQPERVARWLGHNNLTCLIFIPLIGLGPLAASLVALRHGAPAHPGLGGAVAGIFAGGVAATFYALHCPDDSPLFVATWYLIGILGLAAAGAILSRRIARW
ncbi:NrsF family protein [soil metagenome]